jgi:hypothetical protein
LIEFGQPKPDLLTFLYGQSRKFFQYRGLVHDFRIAPFLNRVNRRVF